MPGNPNNLPSLVPPNVFRLTDPIDNFNPTYQSFFETVKDNSNIELGNSVQQLTGLAALSLASNLGVPQVAQLGQSIIGASDNYSPNKQYSTTPFVNLKRTPGIQYQDFRARKGWNITDVLGKRLDGTSAITRKGNRKRWIAATYAAASVLPTGAYSVFNRESNKYFGAGWGDHGNIYALRNDFTAQSHVATVWDNTKQVKTLNNGQLRLSEKWKPVQNPLSKATPFRGDRVQIIDFSQRSLLYTYQWKTEEILGITPPFASDLSSTQDFIKFYFTGPGLTPADKTTGGVPDDIIVFRAIITTLTDTFSPNWTPVTMIGRADSNQQYTGYGRSVQLSFDVYATDRDEMKPIWRKLNALAGYTAPTYNIDSIALEAPWMRITIGDLFFQQPAIITSLTYTLHDNETTWEINIEHDDTMMQAPKHISVTMGLTIITNELPQKGGRFYTLAKRFYEDSTSIPGNDNWLSDFETNEDRRKDKESGQYYLRNPKGTRARFN